MHTLKAVHDGALLWKTIYGIDPKPGTTYTRYEHPVVIRHPDTSREVLFVNRGFTTHLTGVSPQESRFLLEMLFNHIEASPQIQCRVQWRPNTLVMWDNVDAASRGLGLLPSEPLRRTRLEPRSRVVGCCMTNMWQSLFVFVCSEDIPKRLKMRAQFKLLRSLSLHQFAPAGASY